MVYYIKIIVGLSLLTTSCSTDSRATTSSSICPIRVFDSLARFLNQTPGTLKYSKSFYPIWNCQLSPLKFSSVKLWFGLLSAWSPETWLCCRGFDFPMDFIHHSLNPCTHLGRLQDSHWFICLQLLYFHDSLLSYNILVCFKFQKCKTFIDRFY